jgi:hypothetical protein
MESPEAPASPEALRLPIQIPASTCREPDPAGGASVAVIVGAKSQSEMHTANSIWERRLDDFDYVENAAVEVMKRIIHGDLPPGVRERL